MTVQPTEQCVHTVFRTLTSASPRVCALTVRVAPISSVPSAARPPATTPERRRKVRRSRPASSEAMRPDRGFLLIVLSPALLKSTRASSVSVDPIERFDVLGFPVARLGLIGVDVGRGGCLGGRRARCQAGSCRNEAQNL